MKHSVHFSSQSDEWETPQALFEKLNRRFSFTLDAAASHQNHKCARFFTASHDALNMDWKTPGAVWLNPPYSRGRQAAFIRKAHAESLKGATVVCLIPARPDSRVWHDTIFPHAAVYFIKGRLKFGNAKASAPFPSAIVIFGHAPNCAEANFLQ